MRSSENISKTLIRRQNDESTLFFQAFDWLISGDRYWIFVQDLLEKIRCLLACT